MQRLSVANTSVEKRQKKRKAISQPDLLAVEEPLEISLLHGPEDERVENKLAVTMRTPGHDFELTLGFLLTEGLIKDREAVKEIFHCKQVKPEKEGNVVRVSLQPTVELDLKKVERNFYTTSSCGVCGKSSIEALQFSCKPIRNGFTITEEFLQHAPDIMRTQQNVFQHTGGLHAAALFDGLGNLVMLREDIGRHNAMDKLIGAAMVNGMLPLDEYFVMVSGRLGFELVQKALSVGLPVLGAIGAPSSLAVQLAREYNMTVAGFVRADSFNIYSNQERVV